MNQRRRVRVVLAAAALFLTGGLVSAVQADATTPRVPSITSNASNDNPAWVCVTLDPMVSFCQRNPLKPLQN